MKVERYISSGKIKIYVKLLSFVGNFGIISFGKIKAWKVSTWSGKDIEEKDKLSATLNNFSWEAKFNFWSQLRHFQPAPTSLLQFRQNRRPIFLKQVAKYSYLRAPFGLKTWSFSKGSCPAFRSFWEQLLLLSY